MLTAVIADKDQSEINHCRQLLIETGVVDVIGEASDSYEVVASVLNLLPDIVFLEIEIQDLDGIETAKKLIAETNVKYIVLQSRRHYYAVEAFNLNCIDYLLKPYNFHRILRTVNRIQEKNILLKSFKNHIRKSNKLIFKSKGEIFFIDINKVVFIEKDGKNNTIIHTMEKSYQSSDTMLLLHDKLKLHANFQRVHKSYIINLNLVEKISPFADSSYIVKFHKYDKDAIISRGKIDAIKSIFNV